MAEPIISFKKLNITFGENVVINNIDLDIRQGETPVSYTHLTLPTKRIV